MPSTFSTQNRMYFLRAGDHGEDVLLIEEMSGHESLSQLFKFNFRLVSDRDDIDPRDIIGKPAVLRIETYDMDTHGGERHWSGFVSRFHQTGRKNAADGSDFFTYECDLVPWLWFMTRHQDIRIFQNLSIPDIIEKILKDAQFEDYELQLTRTHPKLLYCTQYRESNYAFLCRLMERAGIYAYYKHNQEGSHETKHVLVLSDNVTSNPDMDPFEVLFHHAGMAEGGDAITTLRTDFSMRTGRITLRDWDFTRKAVVEVNTPTCIQVGGNEAHERYEYPGGQLESDQIQYFADVMMQAEEAAFLTLTGESQVRQMEPGYRFKLEDHPREPLNRKYLVVSVDHYGRNNLTSETGTSDYHNRFTVQPDDVPYRSLPATAHPRVHGPQTAIVTGPQGDEIHTDEYGRIKVKFHWDRSEDTDDKTSCWIRVAQAWAGNGYGTMFIPRVGMEVVVDFLEGDPDQPLVTGCVYNGVNKPPYALPAEATKSTIKTLSSKGGGGTNELRFEDKDGSEEVFLQAQKTLNIIVREDRIEHVKRDSDLKIDGKYTTAVRKDFHQVLSADWVNKLTGNFVLDTKAETKLQSEMDTKIVSKKGNVTLATELGSVQAKASMSIDLDGNLISLKSGASSITMNSGMIQIQAPMVTINSGGSGTSVKMPSISADPGNARDVKTTKDGEVTDPVQKLQAQALATSSRRGDAFCAECAAARAAYQALMT